MTAAENQIVVYQPNETVRLDVRLENETVWLAQAKLGVSFGVDRTVVNRHIHNIYQTGELVETATCAKIAQVQNEGGRSITRIVPFYNDLNPFDRRGGLGRFYEVFVENYEAILAEMNIELVA